MKTNNCILLEYQRLRQAAHLAGDGVKNWAWIKTLLRMRRALRKDEICRHEIWPDEHYHVWTQAIEPTEVTLEIAALQFAKPTGAADHHITFHCWTTLDKSHAPLRETIASLKSQIFPNWVLHVVSHSGSLPLALSSIMRMDPRIVRSRQDPFPFTSHTCWHLFLEPGDRLPRWALLEWAKCINNHPAANFIYGDHDQCLPGFGRRGRPVLKPGWSPQKLDASP